MQPETEYRARAAYCVHLTENAKTPQHRLTLLSMAQTWLRMALEAEAINKGLASEAELDTASRPPASY
jgi:hypothetical protein